MTREEVLKLGFKEIGYPTVADILIYDLGRNRQLSFGCIDSPNEIIYICHINKDDSKRIDDLVCVHNYDYDGYITKEKLNKLISGITG